MMDKSIYSYLLSTDGINQLERSLISLDPSSVKIDGRSKRDILRFLMALSKQIRFFDLNNMPQGDWVPFLEKIKNGNDILEDTKLDSLFQKDKNSPPHLALLIAFLKIYSYIQEDINKLTARRLNFYYEEVLKILRRTAAGDQVHIIFELAKNAPPTKLTMGQLLNAGMSADGKPLLYELDSEYVITHSQLAIIMSDIADQDLSGRRIIYKVEDATKVPGIDNGWRPFGAPQLEKAEEERHMEAATMGCAIASPNFFLAEGIREITLVLHLTSNNPLPGDLNLRDVLEINMSTESGWAFPDKISKAILEPDTTGDPINSKLTLIFEYNEGAEAITAYQEEIHQKRIKSEWPVCSLTVKPMSFFLDNLNQFTVGEIEISVDVKGTRNLILQNDQAIQSVDAPVVPFGNAPSINSNFYIGNEEAFSKSITSISLNLQWKDVPENMNSYYSDYGNTNITDGVFQGDLFLLAGKTWHKLTGARQTLFNSLGNQLTKTITIGESTMGDTTAYTGYKRKPDLSLNDQFSQQTTQGFIKLVLTNPTKQDVGNLPDYAPYEAFGHKCFPSIYTQHAIQIAKDTPGVILPQPPYTPTLSSVTLDYIAGDTFRPDTPNLIEQFFSLDVFGASEATESGKTRLVPEHDHQGALYLGLDNAEASQIVSLLFQIEEGSTPGTDLLDADDITWDYLAGDNWKEIKKADILEDKTEGFQVPGLIRLVLGPDATGKHTLMPDGLHWIRASIQNNVEGAANVLEIHSQAARASLQPPEDGFKTNYDNHLQNRLSVDTIKTLKNRNAAIKKISQPYSSFGGRPSESDTGYHQRVHERLRHRNRAVSAWDYERLILEAFPNIYKVKCLPHTDVENNLTPGDVKLVVVPDWRMSPSGNPLQPKVNGAFLREIAEFIQENYSSETTILHVTNPVYETLLVDCKVSFRSGFDPGFYAVQLEDEIKKFLSPWSYDEGEDIVFGGRIYGSEILAFIEGRDYVDYVIDFALYHRYTGSQPGGIGDMKIDVDFVVGLTPEPTIETAGKGKIIGNDFIVGVPVDIAAATRPDAILVSSNSHRISVLGADICEGVQNIGIGQMVIGLDFIIVS
jgi:hypothetical protein